MLHTAGEAASTPDHAAAEASPDVPTERRAEEARGGRVWPVVVLVGVSCLMLAAHFLRSFDVIFMLFFLFLPWLLLIRAAWAARVVQVVLLFGAFEWVSTTLVMLSERRALGEPAGRMVGIMAGVTLFTLAAAAALESSGPRRRFRLRTARFFSTGPSD